MRRIIIKIVRDFPFVSKTAVKIAKRVHAKNIMKLPTPVGHKESEINKTAHVLLTYFNNNTKGST